MSGSVIQDLGPCDVVFNGTSLGKTMGDVQFKYTPESRDIKEDQAGVTPVDGIYVGSTTEVTVPLSRSALSTLAAVIPGATINGSLNLLQVANLVGTSRYASAAALVLKPIIDGAVTTDPKKWLTLLKASPNCDLEVVYNNDSQRVYKIIFKAYPSQTTPIGGLWKIGA